MALLGFVSWGLLSVVWSDDRASHDPLLALRAHPCGSDHGGCRDDRTEDRRPYLADDVAGPVRLEPGDLVAAANVAALIAEDGSVDTVFRGTFGRKHPGIFAVLTLAMVLGLYRGRWRRAVGLVATADRDCALPPPPWAPGDLISSGSGSSQSAGAGANTMATPVRRLPGLGARGVASRPLRLVPGFARGVQQGSDVLGPESRLRISSWVQSQRRQLQGYGYAGVFTEVPQS